MKKKILKNFFRYSLTFSIFALFSFLQFSCSAKDSGTNITAGKTISLKKMELQYGAYDFNMATRFLKGHIHLNYIDKNNYWEFGVWGTDSVNIVKFNGAFYKKFAGRWVISSDYSNFDLPDYINLVLPDKKVIIGRIIQFTPTPVIVRAKNSRGEIRAEGKKLNSLRIRGENYEARLTLLRMLPLLPEYFQTKITIKGATAEDLRILYKRLKNMHPLIRQKGSTANIRLQGYISKKLFNVISGRGNLYIFPLRNTPADGYTLIKLRDNEELYYRKTKQNFKIIDITAKGNDFTIKFSAPFGREKVYGLFIDNNLTAIGRARGVKINFTQYVNSIASFLLPIISTANIQSKITILRFKSPYNGR